LGEGRLPEVVVLNEQERPINGRRLARLARSVIAAEARRCGAGWHPDSELSVVVGDDRWIQELNRKYRNKDAPTDVLAFPQEPVATTNAPLAEAVRGAEGKETAPGLWALGDVAISAETAARQAEELGHTFEEEMAILLAHGILHLTGWRDETAAQRREMMRRVEEVLAEARAEGSQTQGQDP
jgi:probable rRNA maturation factor